MTEEGVGQAAGGSWPKWRRRDERAIKVPVRPTPAEHPTMIGGSGPGLEPLLDTGEVSRFMRSARRKKLKRLVRSSSSGTPWSGHEV